MYSPTQGWIESPYPPRRKPVSKNATGSSMPPGFRPAPRPASRPISSLSVSELQEMHARNQRLLTESTASTSAHVERVKVEQAAIEARLVELVGVESIRTKLAHTTINGDDLDAMNVDTSPIIPNPPPPSDHQPQPIPTKARILASYNPKPRNGRTAAVATISFEEAAQIEQAAHALDRKRHEEIIARKRRQGLPIAGEVLTREEQEARIWAFMNHKPSDSDLEDDEEDDDDDPANWFEDDQDDGRKGQDIVEPDEEDYSHIIRIDDSRIFYPLPRED